jgi:aminopeptidase
MARVEFDQGARNAVVNCLGVSDGDRFLIIGDEATAEIDEALERAASGTGAVCLRIELERYGERPSNAVPPVLKDEIVAFAPTVSAIAIQGQPGEFNLITPLRLLQCRHAQMNGVTRRMMEEGMAADYVEVAKLAERLHTILEPASTIEVRGSGGTDIVATFTPEHRWIGGNAIYREPGRWGNLPAGEVGTSPLTVDGVFATRVLGDVFGRYGLLDEPVRFHVKHGRFTELEAPPGLAEELTEFLTQTDCAGRVGEFAIGCNTSLTELCGDLLQDEKFPGVHIAFGDPYPRETGATWSCDSHMDVVGSDCTVTVDGITIMSDGRFLL